MIEAPNYVLWTLAVAFMFCAFSIMAGPTTVDVDTSCKCAAMNSSDPEDFLVERKLSLNLPCNAEGEKQCNQLCTVMANTTKADPEGAAKFCKYYERDGLLFINVFSKQCGNPYLFTGFSDQTPVCCIGGRNVTCE